MNFNKNHVCASCQLGKAKKHHFHTFTRISEFPLQLIHTDLWTSPIPSVSGYKYYTLFVDDYSSYSWIYPLHSKLETFAAFVQFKSLVENQFSTTIKQLQSDGGSEYTSHQFQSFLTTHSIAYRKSYPYTSPHNGLAERKLRHILETGLTLLAHAQLSSKYWVDSFLTAVYIITRLPTTTLNHCTPYETIQVASGLQKTKSIWMPVLPSPASVWPPQTGIPIQTLHFLGLSICRIQMPRPCY